MFGASATFLNRDTESVVALAPNIGLSYQVSGSKSQENLKRRIT
jgi:hypothetical protein